VSISRSTLQTFDRAQNKDFCLHDSQTRALECPINPASCIRQMAASLCCGQISGSALVDSRTSGLLVHKLDKRMMAREGQDGMQREERPRTADTPAACSAAQARGVPRPNSTSSPAHAAPKPTTRTRTAGRDSMPGRSVSSIRSRSATFRAIASSSSAFRTQCSSDLVIDKLTNVFAKSCVFCSAGKQIELSF